MTNPTNANPKILLEIEPVMTVLEDNDNQLNTQINEDIDPNKSKQYLKNLKSILKLDGMNKEILYECITKKDNSIYKLLFILSKQETISTRKAYICAVKHLMKNVVPDCEENCEILSKEIKDLIFRDKRQTRNKKKVK